jgi:hypothetical protein
MIRDPRPRERPANRLISDQALTFPRKEGWATRERPEAPGSRHASASDGALACSRRHFGPGEPTRRGSSELGLMECGCATVP